MFIRYGYGTAVTAVFQSRLRAAFARHNLSAEKHCIFLPKMDYGRFTAVARLADVFLDAFEWSGCNSVLESLVWNIPPVAYLGQMMRGRHAAAMMAMMEIAETTAKSVGEYVEIAVRLGMNVEFRQAISDRIAAQWPKLLHDRESIRGLENFLAQVVQNPLPA